MELARWLKHFPLMQGCPKQSRIVNAGLLELKQVLSSHTYPVHTMLGLHSAEDEQAKLGVIGLMGGTGMMGGSIGMIGGRGTTTQAPDSQ